MPAVKAPSVQTFIALAVPAGQGKIYSCERKKRVEVSPTAFEKFICTASAAFTPIMVNHNERHAISGYKTIGWRIDDAGLKLMFQIANDGWTGKCAIAAIRHGWLRHVSIAWITDRRIRQIDDAGVYDTDVQSRVDEVSLTDSPLMTKTWVTAHGCSIPAAKTLPENPKDAAQLMSWLRHVGIDTEVPQKTVIQAASLPVKYMPRDWTEVYPGHLKVVNENIGRIDRCKYELHPLSEPMQQQSRMRCEAHLTAIKNWNPVPEFN